MDCSLIHLLLDLLSNTKYYFNKVLLAHNSLGVTERREPQPEVAIFYPCTEC